MCGIAGWLGTIINGKEYAIRLKKALTQRGPDAHGIQEWPEATLVHTRLSIIDLSPSGNQPIANENKRTWTILMEEFITTKS